MANASLLDTRSAAEWRNTYTEKPEIMSEPRLLTQANSRRESKARDNLPILSGMVTEEGG